jgi:hypothetical protein
MEEGEEIDLLGVVVKIGNKGVDRVGRSFRQIHLGLVAVMSMDIVEEGVVEMMAGKLHRDYQMDQDQDDKGKGKACLVAHDQDDSRFHVFHDLVSFERSVLLHGWVLWHGRAREMGHSLECSECLEFNWQLLEVQGEHYTYPYQHQIQNTVLAYFRQSDVQIFQVLKIFEHPQSEPQLKKLLAQQKILVFLFSYFTSFKKLHILKNCTTDASVPKINSEDERASYMMFSNMQHQFRVVVRNMLPTLRTPDRLLPFHSQQFPSNLNSVPSADEALNRNNTFPANEHVMQLVPLAI